MRVNLSPPTASHPNNLLTPWLWTTSPQTVPLKLQRPLGVPPTLWILYSHGQTRTVGEARIDSYHWLHFPYSTRNLLIDREQSLYCLDYGNHPVQETGDHIMILLWTNKTPVYATTRDAGFATPHSKYPTILFIRGRYAWPRGSCMSSPKGRKLKLPR